MKPIQPWHWRSQSLNNRSGSQIFAALFRQPHHPGHSLPAIATLLESPHPTPNPELARYSICAGRPRVIDNQPQLWTPPVGQILPFLNQLWKNGTVSYQRPPASPFASLSTYKYFCQEQPKNHYNLPFTGGWLGWLGYDLAWEIEKLPNLKSDNLPFPVAYWYEPECFAVLDHWEQTLWLATSAEHQLEQLEKQLESFSRSQSSEKLGENWQTNKIVPTFHTQQAEYERMVRQVKNYILRGDIFQANLSLRFETETSSNSWAIYRALQQINPSPFASYWQTPWGDLISCSPERLVHLQGKKAKTRPIAGTRSRGKTPLQDQQLAQELMVNTKEKAEHIMLVDLERNDLGRVCESGSVKVDELLIIERYSHVMHLVSNIIGTVRPDYNSIDLIRAMFPGGTITGCPKIRCLEIIEELEPVRRNLFYGSCGYLDWRGNLDLNILIRTLLFKSQPSGLATVWGQVGAGIVTDSDPEREWHESLHKAEAQLTALKLANQSKT